MTITIILEVDGVDHVCRCFENESVQINKIVGSVDELGKQGTFSKDFFMPLEGGLVDAIGDITDPSIEAKVNLNKAVQGRILVNGFERFNGSFFFINFLVEPIKQVQVSFQGNESNIKAVLSNIKMSELFEGELILYNYSNMVNYFDNPISYSVTNGYCFPLVDYGKQYEFDGNELILYETDFKPAVLLSKCLDLMPININYSGLENVTFANTLTETILLHNNTSDIPTLDTSNLDSTGEMSKLANQTIVVSTMGTTNNLVTFQAESFYQNDIFDLPNDRIQPVASGSYVTKLTGTLRAAPDVGQPNLLCSVRFILRRTFLSGSFIDYEVGRVYALVISGTSNDYELDLTLNTSFNVGDTATIRMEIVPSIGTGIGTASLLTGFKFQVVQSPAISNASNIVVSENCPDITAWDIFRTTALRCNAIVEINEDSEVILMPWKEWIEQGTQSFIIDNIIESKTTPVIRPFSLNGARSINLKFKESEDFYSKKYEELTGEPFGQHRIENTGTEFATNTIEISVPFSSPPCVPVANSSGVIPKLYDKEFETVKGTYLLGSPLYTVMNFPFTFKGAYSGSSTSYLTMPQFSNWNVLTGGYDEIDNNFGQSLSYFASSGYPNNTLYERFWKNYLEQTYSEKSRELKVRLKLSIDEIDKIKFNDKFYYKNTLWRLLKLENIELTKDGYVTATLMKRFTIFNNERAPFYPYDIINSIVQWKDSSDNTDLGDASAEVPSDVEESANYYNYFYDSNRNIATQTGQILIS